MTTLDPESASSLGKQCEESPQATLANRSSEEDLPNQPIAKDLPAGASAEVRAKPVSGRRQSQLTAWTAAIEDRTDVEAFLEILQMKDPTLATTARDDRWAIGTIECAITDPQWILPTPPAGTATARDSPDAERERSPAEDVQQLPQTNQMSVTNGKQGLLSTPTNKMEGSSVEPLKPLQRSADVPVSRTLHIEGYTHPSKTRELWPLAYHFGPSVLCVYRKQKDARYRVVFSSESKAREALPIAQGYIKDLDATLMSDIVLTDDEDKRAVTDERDRLRSQIDSYSRFLQKMSDRERASVKCGGKAQLYIEQFCKRDERLTPAVARLKILFQPGVPVWYKLESVAGVVVLHPSAEAYASSVVIKWPDESFD